MGAEFSLPCSDLAVAKSTSKVAMYTLVTFTISLLLLISMLLALEGGRRVARKTEGEVAGRGATESAIFALLGLLVAFTFSGAASRFEARRALITAEANDIGTAYLRVALLPEEDERSMKTHFRIYLSARLDTYRNRENEALTEEALRKTSTLTQEMWNLALKGTKSPDAAPGAAVLLLPALNAMFDAASSREAAMHNHPPTIVFVLLAFLGVLSAWRVGFAMGEDARRTRLHPLIFACVFSATFFVTIDMEYPRFGLIRVDSADLVLEDIRKQMAP